MWSISYPPPAPGYWQGRPSAINFCEEDYVFTHYIAEFFNAITSALYITYGTHGIIRSTSAKLPYWGLVAIGICSGIYHSTLQYYTQMADEMSMHLALGCVLIQVWSWRQSPEIQRRNSAIIVIGLTSFIIYHCVTDEFALHVVLFFCLSVSVAWKTRIIMKERIKDPAQRKKLGRLLTFATSTALFAYFLWNIDVHFCSTLTEWKHSLGLPWGALLELHGYWHLLTAVSTYTFMAIIEFLTCPEDEDTLGRGFKWPAKAVLQDLVPKQTANGSVHANGAIQGNGHAKGGLKQRVS